MVPAAASGVTQRGYRPPARPPAARGGPPGARPDPQPDRLLARRPAEGIVLVREDCFGTRSHAQGVDRGLDDRIGALVVEGADLVEVVAGLDVVRPQAGLLGHLPQGRERHALAVVQAARDALPEAREDAAGGAADEQELRLGAGRRHAEDPALDEVGADRAHDGAAPAGPARRTGSCTSE